ncbi:hypothetical protein [Dactylosporangium sp. NPDC051484]|uniref:hypothetical protein n=1 Tax=Dactylosporangium sp. NPDC051484 TaxID=3154942 RepID=UPI0034501F9C
MQTSGLSGLFGSRPLGPVAWGIALGVTVLGTALAALPLPETVVRRIAAATADGL